MPNYIDQLYADIQPSYTDALYHHGIKGMKWGVRRYRNLDGSVTPAGKKHYEAGTYKTGDKRLYGHGLRNYAGYTRANREVKKQIKADRRSGQISRKDARSALKEARAKNTARYFENEARMLEVRSKASDKAGRNKYMLGRALNDSRSGRATAAKATADFHRARAAYISDKSSSNRKNVAKAYLKAYGSNLANESFGAANVGAYNRYRKNGASKTKAILKTAYAGSAFRR